MKQLFRFLNRITLQSRLKETQITENLYVGGSYSTKSQLLFNDWGISAIINMRMKKVAVLGVPILHLPTKDRTEPSMADLQKGIAFIQKHVQKGKVYIHCRQGFGRGPTMAIAYFISTGMSLAQALALVQSQRSYARPNKRQLAQLEKIEQMYRKE